MSGMSTIACDVSTELRDRYPKIPSETWDNLGFAVDHRWNQLVAYDLRNKREYVRINHELLMDPDIDVVEFQVIPALLEAAPIHRRMYPKIA
jgi:hypothetical protein